MINLEIKNIDCHATLAMTENAQSGRSMIEMLGVLAIIGVLSVGGIAGYSKAMMKYRINKTIEQITLIAGNVRTFFAPQGNYDGLWCNTNNMEDCPIVRKAKLVPDEMLTLTNGKITAITNSFGGGVSLFEYFKGFEIDFDNIPDEACIELLTYDWSIANIDIISIFDDVDDEEELNLPIDISEAVNKCSSRGNEMIQFKSNK